MLSLNLGHLVLFRFVQHNFARGMPPRKCWIPVDRYIDIDIFINVHCNYNVASFNAFRLCLFIYQTYCNENYFSRHQRGGLICDTTSRQTLLFCCSPNPIRPLNHRFYVDFEFLTLRLRQKLFFFNVFSSTTTTFHTTVSRKYHKNNLLPIHPVQSTYQYKA